MRKVVNSPDGKLLETTLNDLSRDGWTIADIQYVGADYWVVLAKR